MDDMTVFLDVLRKINNMVHDMRGEHENPVLVVADENLLTITVVVEPLQLGIADTKKPTKKG
jgi:hypothetical protein